VLILYQRIWSEVTAVGVARFDVGLVAEFDAAGAASAIAKRGLIRRHTVEMNMNKIESVDVDQTLLGRLFNYGNVTIRGTGSTFEPLHMIDAPLKLRTTVTAG
jgi:hypothetical protein